MVFQRHGHFVSAQRINSVCVCVSVCVTYLLWDCWMDLVHIWCDDRYNTDVTSSWSRDLRPKAKFTREVKVPENFCFEGAKNLTSCKKKHFFRNFVKEFWLRFFSRSLRCFLFFESARNLTSCKENIFSWKFCKIFLTLIFFQGHQKKYILNVREMLRASKKTFFSAIP